MARDAAKKFFNDQRKKVKDSVRSETDLRKSIRKHLEAENAMLRAGLDAEKAEFDASYADAIGLTDQARAAIDEAIDDILASTGNG